ncbi:flagellar hook-length control protein FliK [Tepidamorphus sp. 3E244]|uniref:flagellar hook-length control protein FliK n=1 Tax=Tepidamorphus sp. 3E244 TaxID=3385498 RepID=UPI0038FC54B5
MTTASVISFLQPGIQPGLKANAGAAPQKGETPFAQFMSAIGLEPETVPGQLVAASRATAKVDGAATRAQKGPALPAPLQFLKLIGEALETQLAEGGDLAELAEAGELPAEIENLLQQFVDLPGDALAQLESLIGPQAVAGLQQLSQAAGIGTQADVGDIAGVDGLNTPTAPASGPPAGDEMADQSAKAPVAPTTPPATPPAPGTADADAVPASTAAATGEAAKVSDTASKPATAPVAEPKVGAAASVTANAAQAQATTGDQPETPATKPAGESGTKPAADAAPAQARATGETAAKTGLPAQPVTARAGTTAGSAASDDSGATASATATSSASGSSDAETVNTARETTRNGLRTLLEKVIGTGSQMQQAQGATQQGNDNSLGATIRAAAAARQAQSAGLSADAPTPDMIPTGGTPAQADPILIAGDRALPPGVSAPARSVTLPAYGTSLPVAQLAVTISSQARGGTRHFDIRLDPPEMGRIDVRLEMGRDGTLNAHLTVDRPETYDAMNRDARQLERMLQQSGMKLDNTSLQFSLRDGGEGRHGSQAQGEGSSNNAATASQREDDAAAPVAPAYMRGVSDALVDIEV